MSSEHTQNPFFNRQRITDPKYFHGREEEVEALYSAIVTRQGRSIVGERKMGKSSLLTQISCPQTLIGHNIDPAKYAFVYVDLEGLSNITYEEFWPEVMDLIELALPPDQERLRNMAGDMAMSGEVRFMQVRRFMRRLDRAGVTLVMMLDEFESLARNVAFDAGFYGELRSLAGELGVVYLTISKHSLYDLTYQHEDTLSSPFFNIFSELQLNLLPMEEAHGLLAGLSRQHGDEPLTAEQISLAVELAGPHPFFLQVAGYHLFEARLDGVPAADVEERVRRRFKAETEDHYRYLWSQLSDDEQIALQQRGRADIVILKQLQQKALLRETADGQYKPFNKTFADFIERQAEGGGSQTGRSDQTRHISNGLTAGLTGRTLGRYRVLTPVGRGGMATVYRGYQSSLDRYVAIKVMSQQLIDDQSFTERFQREASSVAQLRHQNIVQMFDFGLHEGISYMVMEFIDGPTLKDRLVDARADRTQRFSIEESHQVLTGIANALDYAHAHSIVHRDVKPANIMLRPEQKLAELTGSIPFSAVLTDFGVARMLEGIGLTQTGAAVGTPDYMSPEQAGGQPATAASDVYALGIVLYEMLTGERPFRGETPMAVLLQHIDADPPSVIQQVPHLPLSVDEIINKAMAKNPDHRYPTAGAMAADLARIVR